MKQTLPAFKVVYEDGSSYLTSMATEITEADAKAYFIGRSFEQDDERTHKKVADVKLIQPWGTTTDTWPEHLAKLKKEAMIEGCNEMIRRSAVSSGHISDEAWSQ